MRQRSSRFTTWARWLATFVGFPAAGVVARLVVGDVDDLGAAAAGGLAAGAVLGAVQSLIGGISPGDRVRWVGATAGGLSLGLATGAGFVDYRTDTTSLVVMGAVCGAGVGIAQALSLPMSGRDRLLWAVATPLLWAGGWLITSQVIVDADRHHALFGSSGAIVVSAVSGLLVANWRTAGAQILQVSRSSYAAGAS